MSLAQLVDLLFTLYSFAILARSLLSMLRVDPYQPVMRFLIQITEPMLRPLREHIPPVGPFDITPMIALLILWLINSLLQLLLMA